MGGTWSFEWPSYCSGWSLPILGSFFKSRCSSAAFFHGCALGLLSLATGQPIKKPWTVMTSNRALARSLDACRCSCPRGSHVPCQGKDTSRTESYTRTMAKRVITCLANSSSCSKPLVAAARPKALSAIKLDPSQEGSVDLSYASEDGLVESNGHRPLASCPTKCLGLVTRVIPPRSPEFHSQRGKSKC